MKSKNTTIIQDDPKVSFIHVPKTAGQAICAAFGHKPKAHLRAGDFVSEIEESDFAFCFVRHPLQRAVSTYHWFQELHQKPTKRLGVNAALGEMARAVDVNEFWQKLDIQYIRNYTPNVRENSHFTLVDGKVPESLTVFQYEQIERWWPIIQSKTGVGSLPVKNRSTAKHWSEELNKTTEKKLRSFYALDFDTFGYD